MSKIQITQAPAPAIECVQLERAKYSRISALSLAQSEPCLFVCSVAFRGAVSKERARRVLTGDLAAVPGAGIWAGPARGAPA